MVAVLAAVLALAGAPADTRVECVPTLAAMGNTYLIQPPILLLGPTACASILLSAASPKEWAEIQRLNPNVNLAQTQAVGLLVVLHESEHAALDSRDETLVQCAAMQKVAALYQRYTADSDRAMVYARQSDATLGPAYHAYSC